MKECKNCTSFREENFVSMVGQWCVKKEIDRFSKQNDTTAELCEEYKHRFWAFWVEN